MQTSSKRVEILKLIAEADAPAIALVLETLIIHDSERELRQRRHRAR